MSGFGPFLLWEEGTNLSVSWVLSYSLAMAIGGIGCIGVPNGWEFCI